MLHFNQALGEEPDYDDDLLQSAVKLLDSHHAYTAAETLSKVLAGVAKTPARQAKKQRRAPNESADGAADAAAAAGVASGDALDAQIEGLVARWGQGSGASPKTYDEAEQAYKQALDPLSVGVFDAGAAGAYNSQFNAMAQQAEGKGKVRYNIGRYELCMLSLAKRF